MEHEPVKPILKNSAAKGGQAKKQGTGNKHVRFSLPPDTTEDRSPGKPSRREQQARYREAWRDAGLPGEPLGLNGMMSPKAVDRLVGAELRRMEQQWAENTRLAETDSDAPPAGPAPTPLDARHEVVQNIDMVWQYATGRTGPSPNVPHEARPRSQWGVHHWATWLLHAWDSSHLLPAVAHATGYKPALGAMTEKARQDLELRGRLERAAVMDNARRAEQSRAKAAAYREKARIQTEQAEAQGNTPAQRKEFDKSVAKLTSLAEKYKREADRLYLPAPVKTPTTRTGPGKRTEPEKRQETERSGSQGENDDVPAPPVRLVKEPVAPGEEEADQYATVHTVVDSGDHVVVQEPDAPRPAQEVTTRPAVRTGGVDAWARDFELWLTGLTGTTPADKGGFLPGAGAAERSPHIRENTLGKEEIDALTVSDLKGKFHSETLTHPDGFEYTVYFVHPNIAVADVANINDLIQAKLYSDDLKGVAGEDEFFKESKLSDETLLDHVKDYLLLFDAIRQHGSSNQRELLAFIERGRVVDPDDIDPAMGRIKYQTDLSPAVPHDADGREVGLVVLSPTKSVSPKSSHPDGVYSERARTFAKALGKAKKGDIGQANVTPSNPRLNAEGYGTGSYVQVTATEFDFGVLDGKPFVTTPDESVLHEFGHVRQNAQGYDVKTDSRPVTITHNGQTYDITTNINELRTHGNPDVLRARYGPGKTVDDIQKELYRTEVEDKWQKIKTEIEEEMRDIGERITKLNKSPGKQDQITRLEQRLEALRRAQDINTERLDDPLSETVHAITDWNSVRQPHIRQFYSPLPGTDHQIVTMPLHSGRLTAAVTEPKNFADWVVSQQNNKGKLDAAQIRKWATSCSRTKRGLGSGCAPLPSGTDTLPEVKKIAGRIRKDINVFSKTNDILSGKTPVRSGGRPTVVYRVDSRAPEVIAAQQGFKVPGPGTDNDVFNHIWDISTRKGSGNTNLVSTSQDINQMVAQRTQILGGKDAWVYVIAPGENFVSVQSELERIINDPNEPEGRRTKATEAIALGAYKAEWDARGGVDLDSVHLAFRIDVDSTGNVAPVRSSVWFNREGYEKSRSSLLSVFTACTSSRQRRDALCARFDLAELREQAAYYGIENEPAVRTVLGPDQAPHGGDPALATLRFAPGKSRALTASDLDTVVRDVLVSNPVPTTLRDNGGTGRRGFHKSGKGFSRRVAGGIDSAADLKDLALYLKGFYDLVKSGEATVGDYLMHGVQIVPGVGNAFGLVESAENGEWDGIVYHGGSLALLPYAMSNPYAAVFLVAAAEVWDEYQNHKNWVRTEENIKKRKEGFRASMQKNWESYLRRRLSAVLQLSAEERQDLATYLVLMRETAVQQIELDYCQFKFYNTPREEVARIAARKGPDGISACLPEIQPGKRVLIVNGVSGDPRYQKAREARQKIAEVDEQISKIRSFFAMNATSPETVDFSTLKAEIDRTLKTDFSKLVRQGVHGLTEELAGAQDGNYPNLIKFAMWLAVDNSPSPSDKPYSNSPAFVNGRWRTYGMEEEILQEMDRFMKETMTQCENWAEGETTAAQDGRLAVLRVSVSGNSGGTAATGTAEIGTQDATAAHGGPSWSVAGIPATAFPDAAKNVTLTQDPTRLSAVLGAPVRHGHPARVTLKGGEDRTVTMHVKKTRRGKTRYAMDGSYGMKLHVGMSDGRNKTFCFTHQQNEHAFTARSGVSLDVVMEDVADRSVSVHLPNSRSGGRPDLYTGAGEQAAHSWNGPQQNELFYTFEQGGDEMQLGYRDGVRLTATYLGGGRVRYIIWNEPSDANVYVRIGDAAPVKVGAEMHFEERTVTPVTLIRP
ncbi:enterotoxin A family protein [Streptomyces gamaensis]|uniref:Enterotoxin A family protein n=1 Tax=Streptomyces gamaensis TaxID=1763542 RepID=A0ABW0Z244_9ACTN